jgi:hypothetical protein
MAARALRPVLAQADCDERNVGRPQRIGYDGAGGTTRACSGALKPFPGHEASVNAWDVLPTPKRGDQAAEAICVAVGDALTQWAGWKRWLDWAKLEESVRGNGPTTKASRRALFLARTSVSRFKAPPLLKGKT